MADQGTPVPLLSATFTFDDHIRLEFFFNIWADLRRKFSPLMTREAKLLVQLITVTVKSEQNNKKKFVVCRIALAA